MDNNLQEALNAVQKLKGMSASQYIREAHRNYQSYGRFEDILHQHQYDAEADYIHTFYMEGYRWEEYCDDCL